MMKIKSLFFITIIFAGLAFGQGTTQTATDYVAKRIEFTLLNPPQQVSFASVAVSGNPGPATYYYWIVTQTSLGASSPAGPFPAWNAPNSLSVSNFAQISWSPVPGAISYDVLRTNNAGPPFGSCNCAVATAVTGTSTNDQANSLNAYTVSSLDISTVTWSLTNESSSNGGSAITFRNNGAVKFQISSSGIQFTSLSNIQFASQYPGVDWCAKVSAADTALGQKGGQIWVDKSAGTSCAAGFTLHNSLKFIDDADYSARTITIGTGGISIEGMGLTNTGSTPFGTRLMYVGSVGSDLISIVGSSGAQLDKIRLENLLLDGNNTARYTMLVQWANAGTVKDVRFQGAATAGTYFQTSIDWKFYNVGWTFCQGSSGAGFCAIWDGGSGNNHIYGGQTEQGGASTNPQFVFSGSINSFVVDGMDFDSCTPFGGFALIQGQDGANSSFAGALTGVGQGRPINVAIRGSFLNYCTGSTTAAQGADILITDASAAQQPTNIHLEDLQMTGGAAPAQVAVKIDQAQRVFMENLFSTGHTAGTAATVQATSNASLITMWNVVSGDTNRIGGTATAIQDCQASPSNFYTCSGGFRFGDGATATPSIAWANDTGTGWSRPGAGYARFSTNGNDDFLISTTGPVIHTGFVYGMANGDTFASTCATGTGEIAQGVVGSSTSCSNANANGSFKAASYISGGAAATLSGTGACATITTQTGGSMAGSATCTGTTGASTLTITPGTTAPHGWVCYVPDQTTRANLLQQTANTATSCTLTATSVTQNDVVVFTAIAF